MIAKVINYVVCLIAILELLNLKLIKCGSIEVQDYELDYTNRNDVTQMKFIFRLSSGLGKNNYLRLSFPTPDKIFTTSISKVGVYYSYQGTNGCSAMSKQPAIITLDGASQTDYLISFLDDINQPAELLASPNWYALYIYPEAGVLFTKGMLAPIQARTQSIDTVPALYGTPIIYDVTNSFAVLEFEDYPSLSLGATMSISSLYTSLVNIIGMKYEVSFIVKPDVDVKNGARIIFKINKDPKFKFVGLCVSEENSDATGTTPPLDSSEYTCTVDKENNRVVVSVNAGLVRATIYRFRVAIQNPNYVSLASPDIEIRTMMSNSNKIIEKKIILSALSVSSLTSTQRVIMGNGINLSDATYRKRASIISGVNFYNPFQFQFKPSIQTPDKVKLRVNFKLKMDMLNDAVLTGSIQHNFPRYDSSIPVKCILGTAATNYYIQCDEVGPLSTTNFYFSTARVYFAATTPLDTSFGSVSVYTIDEDTGAPSILIPEVSQTFASNLISTNLNVVDTSVGTYGYQMVHSQTSYDSTGAQLSLSPILSSNAGIKVCSDTSQLQKIVITLNAGINGSFGVAANRGIRLTTTPQIKAVPGSVGSQFYVESLNGGCTISTDFPADNDRMITTYTEYTDILMVQATSSTSCMSLGGSTSTFSIGDVQILSHSSSYAGRDAFDFYGALYSSATTIDGTTTPSSYFAVNANTISLTGSSCSLTQLQYINIALSNFQTSLGGQSQIANGAQYTAFIRVTGYLTNDESYQAKRIAIFFNNVDFYPLSIDDFGQQKVSCSSSMNPNQQCWGFSGKTNESQSVHSMKRVEFDVAPFIAQTGSSSPFQLLIPVKAIASLFVQRLQVAVLVSNPFFGHLTQAYQISKTMTQYSIKTGSTAAYHSTLSDLSYQLIVSTRTQGNTEDAQLNIGHNLSVATVLQNNPSSDPINIGAAFVIVGDWKMYTDTLSLATTSVVNTNVMSEHCLPFSYIIGIVNKYGIYCPFTYKDASITVSPTTSVTFNNFLYPALGPLKLGTTSITWSQNNGALLTWNQDTNLVTETLNPNKITNVANIQLKRYFKDSRVEWLFTTTNPFPKNGKITIKLDDSGNPWGFAAYTGNLARCILFQQTGSFQETACTVSITGITLEFTFAATTDFPAANYKLVQYGMQSPSTSLSKTYAITISTETAAGVIDQSNSASTLTFDNSVSLNTSVASISFSFTHSLVSNSVGNLDLFFRIFKRPVLALSTPAPGPGLIAGQYIQIDISQESTMSCFALKGGVTYFGFKSIDFSNANQIRLFPREDIAESTYFQLRCLNVINQYQAVQSYKIDLLFNDGATKTVITGTLTPTGAANPAYPAISALTSALLQKFNGKAGAKYHYVFQLTASATGITKSSTIFLTFPQKYDHKLGTDSLHCRVDDKVVYCINFNERSIRVTAFPVTIAAGTQFNLEVYGVNAPLNSAGGGNIQINISTTDDPANVVEQASVLDVATIGNTAPSFYIVSSTQTNTYAREQNLYQFNLKFGSIISAGQYIYIEYPLEFGTSVTVSPPTSCEIYSTDDATLYGQGCTIFGGNIMIAVSASIPADEFKVLIKTIINPEDTLCKITKVMISVLSSDRTQILGRSTIATSNQQQFRSAYSSTLRYMNWFLDTTKIVYNFNTINIIAGTYSSQITIKDESGSINRMITYDLLPLNNADFQLISDKKVYPGQLQEYLRIGCPSTSIPGLFTLIFTKQEQNAVATYGNLSLLNVIVTNQQHIISPEYTTYQVFAGGYSLSINFDLSNMLPYDNVSIQLTIVPGVTDPKIDLIDENDSVVPQMTLNFSPTKPKGSIIVRSAIYMTATPAHWSELKITIFGTDANAYKVTPSLITLQLISLSPIPDFVYTQTIDQVSPSAIKQNLKVSANLPCTIFYHIRVQNGPDRTLFEIMNLVDQYVVLNPVDYYQEQFGFFNYENLNLEGLTASYQISNLRSKMTYTITTWALDSLLRVSDKIDFSFTTKNNNGRVMKLPIVFQKDITKAQKNKIACFMCEQFAIPCLNVMSFDSVYCNSESELQLSIVDSVNTLSQRRVLEEGKDEEKYAENEAHIRNLQSTTTYSTVNFFSLSIDQYEQDISWNTIIKIVEGSSFATNLAAYDTTLPTIQSIGEPTEINQQTAPILVNLPTVQAGKTWIFVDKIETNINSLIWMYIVDVSNGGTPSKQQMKYLLTSRNKTTPSFQILTYDQVTPVSYNFTGLVSDKQYALYFMGTTENPSLFAPVSSVFFVGQKTAEADKEESTHQSILACFAHFIIILILLL